MRSFVTLATLLSLAACATPRSPEPSPRDATALFPLGSYAHSVSIKSHERSFSFRGAVERAEDHLEVVGLSPFGTTAFRLHEDLRTSQITLEFYVELLRRFEGKVRELYPMLRSLLLAERHPAPDTAGILFVRWDLPGKNPVEGRATIEGGEAVFQLSDYDGRDIPKRVSVTHPKFTLELEVTDAQLR